MNKIKRDQIKSEIKLSKSDRRNNLRSRLRSSKVDRSHLSIKQRIAYGKRRVEEHRIKLRELGGF